MGHQFKNPSFREI